MIVLGIETSCDETAAAVLELGSRGDPKPRRSRLAKPDRSLRSVKILSNLIASQHEIHAPYGGIFPELASRRHIEVIRPLVEDALKEAALKIAGGERGSGLAGPSERGSGGWGPRPPKADGAAFPPIKIDGVAVTHTPGLVGSLLVGLSFAKAYAFGLGVPFIGVSHLEGHLNAPLLEHPEIGYPHIGLVVSGGHTALYFVKKFGDYRFLGGTRDDAAGEAFDKVAKILGLGYPGGPLIDKEARAGNPQTVKFPKPKMKGYDFSFSGLKTAVKQLVHIPPSPPLPNLCASFQETVVDILIEKTLAAAKNRRCKTVLVTGGVACNSRLRVKLTDEAKKQGRKAYFASPILSTDNAAMIAYVGGRRLMKGERSSLSLNAIANLSLRN